MDTRSHLNSAQRGHITGLSLRMLVAVSFSNNTTLISLFTYNFDNISNNTTLIIVFYFPGLSLQWFTLKGRMTQVSESRDDVVCLQLSPTVEKSVCHSCLTYILSLCQTLPSWLADDKYLGVHSDPRYHRDPMATVNRAPQASITMATPWQPWTGSYLHAISGT